MRERPAHFAPRFADGASPDASSYRLVSRKPVSVELRHQRPAPEEPGQEGPLLRGCLRRAARLLLADTLVRLPRTERFEVPAWREEQRRLDSRPCHTASTPRLLGWPLDPPLS